MRSENGAMSVVFPRRPDWHMDWVHANQRVAHTGKCRDRRTEMAMFQDPRTNRQDIA